MWIRQILNLTKNEDFFTNEIKMRKRTGSLITPDQNEEKVNEYSTNSPFWPNGRTGTVKSFCAG
jgi:hypothetical protein